MPQRVPPRLRPYGEAVRLLADRNLLHRSRRGVECVHHVVISARDPEGLSVSAHVAHVWTPTSRNRPRSDDFPGSEVHYCNVAWTMRRAMNLVRSAIGDVQLGRISAGIQTMRSHARVNKPDLFERTSVDQEDAIGHHVGHVEDLAIGRNADVLRHAALGQFQVTQDFTLHEVNLHHRAVELAGKDGVTSVYGKVGVIDAAAVRSLNGVLESHGVRIAQVKPPVGLSHHDGRLPVWREIQVVWINNGDILPPLAGLGIDGRQTSFATPHRIVRHPESLQVPRRYDVLRVLTHLEMIYNLVGCRIDDIYVVRLDIGHVDAWQCPCHYGTQHVRPCLAVEVRRVHNRWHSRNGCDGFRRRGSRCRGLGSTTGGHDCKTGYDAKHRKEISYRSHYLLFRVYERPVSFGEVFSVALHSFVLQQSWCSQFRSRPTVQARHLPASDRPRRRRRYCDQPRCGRARRGRCRGRPPIAATRPPIPRALRSLQRDSHET